MSKEKLWTVPHQATSPDCHLPGRDDLSGSCLPAPACVGAARSQGCRGSQWKWHRIQNTEWNSE
eukprot:1143010-Pelagomonas_calceolata.AAC.2